MVFHIFSKKNKIASAGVCEAHNPYMNSAVQTSSSPMDCSNYHADEIRSERAISTTMGRNGSEYECRKSKDSLSLFGDSNFSHSESNERITSFVESQVQELKEINSKLLESMARLESERQTRLINRSDYYSEIQKLASEQSRLVSEISKLEDKLAEYRSLKKSHRRLQEQVDYQSEILSRHEAEGAARRAAEERAQKQFENEEMINRAVQAATGSFSNHQHQQHQHQQSNCSHGNLSGSPSANCPHHMTQPKPWHSPVCPVHSTVPVFNHSAQYVPCLPVAPVAPVAPVHYQTLHPVQRTWVPIVRHL